MGARLEAGAAASRPRGRRKRGAGPSPWAPQDARTKPAPGTSNDKLPARPAPRRTSSGRGTAGARKTRTGASARDRPPQPAGAHRWQSRKPGLEFFSLSPPLALLEKRRKGSQCAGYQRWNEEWGKGRRVQVLPGAGREVKQAWSPDRGEIGRCGRGNAKPGLD